MLLFKMYAFLIQKVYFISYFQIKSMKKNVKLMFRVVLMIFEILKNTSSLPK